MRAITTIVLSAVSLLLAASMVIPAALGYHRYVITSGSMTGTHDRGSIVYAKPVPVSALRVGDVITYTPPAGARLLTHRIVWRGVDRSGAPAFRTKGDANTTADPWRFVLDRPTQDRAVFTVPLLGYAFAALGRPQARLILIGLPGVLIAISILRGVWRRAGEEVARREPAGATGA